MLNSPGERIFFVTSFFEGKLYKRGIIREGGGGWFFNAIASFWANQILSQTAAKLTIRAQWLISLFSCPPRALIFRARRKKILCLPFLPDLGSMEAASQDSRPFGLCSLFTPPCGGCEQKWSLSLSLSLSHSPSLSLFKPPPPPPPPPRRLAFQYKYR